VHPGADGGDELRVVAEVAELPRRGRQQLVRRAVAARAAVLQQVRLPAVRHLACAVDGRGVVDDQIPGGRVDDVHAPAVPAVDLADRDRDTVAHDGDQLVGPWTGDGDLQGEERRLGDVGGEVGGDRAAHERILVVGKCRCRVVRWSSE
jgi:hypothetical protein